MEFEFENMEVPKELDEVVKKSIDKVREERKVQKKRKWVAGATGIAACMAVIAFGASNPAAAAKLPLVGHIFERMQDEFSYGGDYSGIGEVLTSEEDSIKDANSSDSNGESGQDEDTTITADQTQNQYTQTVDGVTITLSEIYCNQQAIYLSLELKSDETIPEIYNPQFFTTEKYSFNETTQYDSLVLNGKRLDDHTYAGLIRFDLNNKNLDMTEIQKEASPEGNDEDYWDMVKEIDIPETFTLGLDIDEIRGPLMEPPVADRGVTQEEIENMTDEEWQAFNQKWDEEHPNWEDEQEVKYEGPWHFSLDVTVNKDDVQTVDLAEKAANGLGFSKIVKDRFEITMYDLNDVATKGEYFPVILDANGCLMNYGDGGSINTVAINDSDISTIYLYLINNDLWMNSLKSVWWKTSEGLKNAEEIHAFKKLLDDNCAYQTEVHFE